jgi:predicted enzyme related to lactoylglutathione lyase
MGNPVVHFEVGGAEHKPLEEFYTALFGWGLQTLPNDSYTTVDTRGGAGINGGIGRSRSGEPWATFYVAVDDLQATLSKAESLGGRTAVPISEVPGVVTWAMFTDPDGLLVGLIRNEPPPEGAQLGPSAGDGTPVDWFEVLGTSAERTQAFYTELFGWKLNTDMPTYGLVDTQSQQGGIQGGVGLGQGTPWATVYASVADVERTLARAEELGGTRVYGPLAVDDHMQTGAFRDPAGNVFGVYHHVEH